MSTIAKWLMCSMKYMYTSVLYRKIVSTAPKVLYRYVLSENNRLLLHVLYFSFHRLLECCTMWFHNATQWCRILKHPGNLLHHMTIVMVQKYMRKVNFVFSQSWSVSNLCIQFNLKILHNFLLIYISVEVNPWIISVATLLSLRIL